MVIGILEAAIAVMGFRRGPFALVRHLRVWREMPAVSVLVALDQRRVQRTAACRTGSQPELVKAPSVGRELRRDRAGLRARPLAEHAHVRFNAGSYPRFVIVRRELLPGLGHSLILRNGERQRPTANDATRTSAVFVLVQIGMLREVDDAYPGRVGLVCRCREVIGVGEILAAGEKRQGQQAKGRADRHGACPFAESG